MVVGYILFAATLVGARFALSSVFGVQSWLPKLALYAAVSLSAVVAIVVGLRRHRPAHATPWRLFALSQVVYLAADLCFYITRYGFHHLAYPAPADLLYILHYPPLIIGLFLLLRRRRSGPDRAGLLDALIVVTAATLVSWLTLIQPYVSGHGLSFLIRTTSVAYPIMDVFVLAVVVRLLSSGGRRVPSLHLLTASVGFLLVSDAVYGWMQIKGTYTTGNFLDATWLACFICLGAAALHPSMAQVSARVSLARESLTKTRLTVLSAMSLVAPALLVDVALRDHEPRLLAIAIASALLFLLVVGRLAGLMGTQRGALAETLEAHAALSAGELELQRALADLKSLESDKAALLGRAVEIAELERVRLAGELHDGAIQHLASVVYGLDRTINQLAQGQTTEATQMLETTRHQLSGEIADLRRLMGDLRPPVLDEGGLCAAIVDYANAFAARTGIRHHVECNEVSLEPECELVIYRVVQEALTNVANHAGSSAVTIRLGPTGDDVELEVHDDGCGFDTSRLPQFVRDHHFGLIGMRERVERMGAIWDLRSAPGDGTQVRVVVPMLARPIDAGLQPVPVAV
jgi:signal transduction histidine kinase